MRVQEPVYLIKLAGDVLLFYGIDEKSAGYNRKQEKRTYPYCM